MECLFFFIPIFLFHTWTQTNFSAFYPFILLIVLPLLFYFIFRSYFDYKIKDVLYCILFSTGCLYLLDFMDLVYLLSLIQPPQHIVPLEGVAPYFTLEPIVILFTLLYFIMINVTFLISKKSTHMKDKLLITFLISAIAIILVVAIINKDMGRLMNIETPILIIFPILLSLYLAYAYCYKSKIPTHRSIAHVPYFVIPSLFFVLDERIFMPNLNLLDVLLISIPPAIGAGVLVFVFYFIQKGFRKFWAYFFT
ncbi:hypothetical protein MsAg5_14850 [Methanosarcinaceae archaeon Ag5]|uniref:Uncharacterized protein n=1 Tax=Methanolapillus africanus TaxID=3028297 RepID=A0AAE4SEG0_9EURY|nr:hypothetical protein [Methanosarcinaceae archaeon Ag5]